MHLCRIYIPVKKVSQRGFSSLVPGRVNSEAIQHLFRQYQGICYDASTNPTYHQYQCATNATMLTASSFSRKGNAKRAGAAFPFAKLKKYIIYD